MIQQRRLLIAQEQGSYHLTSHLVDGLPLLTDYEKEHFMKLMERFAEGYFVNIHTFCIMGTHFHILATMQQHEARILPMEELLRRYREMHGKQADPPMGSKKSNGDLIPDADLGDARLRERLGSISSFVQELKQTFSHWYNKKHKRKGTMWRGRFNSVLVSHSESWLICKSYIDLNPVRAGLVGKPEKYRWSGMGLKARDYKRADELLHPGKYELQNEQIQQPGWYRQFVYLSGGVQVEGKANIAPEIVQEVVSFHGKMGIGDRLSYRFRNISEGMAFGSEEFVKSIQKKEERKFHRARRVLESTALFSTRVLKNITP